MKRNIPWGRQAAGVVVLLLAGNLVLAGAKKNQTAAGGEPGAYQITGVKTYTLGPMSLGEFGNPAVTPAVLERAKRNGLAYIDRPSIGSGLARTGENEFVGITDRGPNAKTGGEDATAGRMVFPLPEFCPSIQRLKLVDDAIKITEVIPLRDSKGKLITGLNNSRKEETLYASPNADQPLAPDPDGVDPEGIRVLPGGNFLLVEEYSPSIFVVSAKGEVLVRYTPANKPLPGATYPVKAILPEVMTQRRVNHGFESVALSADGRTAYAILQCPMGDAKDARYTESRMVRVLKLDIADPLRARVTGEYLLPASLATAYSAKQKQDKINMSDAEWLGPDQLLVIERGKESAKLMLVDLREATNVLGHKKAGDLTFEQVGTDLAALGVKPARTTELFNTKQAPMIDSLKLEGLAFMGRDELAIANDNDFGIGDNTTGMPSKIWVLKLNRAIEAAK